MSRYTRPTKSPIKLVLFMLLIVGIAYILKDSLLNVSNKVTSNAGITEDSVREIVRSEIEKIFEERPELIVSSIKKFQQNEMEKESQESNEAVQKHVSDLHNIKSFPGFGAINPKDYIVQFFDYNCGYCQRSAEVLKEYVDKNMGTRVILIDFPILGDNSVNLAKVAAAVYKLKPQVYSNFYFKLINESHKNIETAKSIALSLGINQDDLEDVLKSTYPDTYLSKSRTLGMDIKVRGTPFIIINGKVFNQGLDVESIDNFIKSHQ